MFTKCSKLFVILLLLLVPLICLAIGIATIAKYQQIYGCYNNRPPLISFDVSIDPSQSQNLVDQLMKFANKNGFSYDVSYYSQDGEDFSVWMERKDVEVIARSPFTRGEFRIGFYNNDCVNQTTITDIESLVVDLKKFLGEIPNIEISERISQIRNFTFSE
jgi:hypothetical protein